MLLVLNNFIKNLLKTKSIEAATTPSRRSYSATNHQPHRSYIQFAVSLLQEHMYVFGSSGMWITLYRWPKVAELAMLTTCELCVLYVIVK